MGFSVGKDTGESYVGARWLKMDPAARASRYGARTLRKRWRIEIDGQLVSGSSGGVTVSTGSIAAWEACRGVGTRNRLQN